MICKPMAPFGAEWVTSAEDDSVALQRCLERIVQMRPIATDVAYSVACMSLCVYVRVKLISEPYNNGWTHRNQD